MTKIRSRLGAPIVLAVLAAYPIAAFYPYQWEPPERVKNPVAWLGTKDGLQFSGLSIARTTVPPSWMQSAIGSGNIEINLRVAPSNRDQSGPARIFTVSRSHSQRNVTLAQDGPDLVIWLRTPETNLDGQPGLRVSDVFLSTDLVDVSVLVADWDLTVLINGQPRVRRHLGPSSFENWDTSYRLALGNELDPDREWLISLCTRMRTPCGSILDPIVATSDRMWTGVVKKAEVRTDSGVVDYAKPGQLVIPKNIWVLRKDPDLIPFRPFLIQDTLINLLGFIPFGFVLARSISGRLWLTIALAALGGLVCSLGLETAQLFLPARTASSSDVLLNTAGSVLGAAFGMVRSLRN